MEAGGVTALPGTADRLGSRCLGRGGVGRGSARRSLPHGPELDPPRRPVSRVSRLLPQAKELEFIIEP